MKFIRKKPVFILVFILIAVTAFTLEIGDLQNAVTDFSGTMAKSLPFNSSLGLNWSDAYVGKFFPSFPPHFGVGGVFGITTIDVPGLEKVTGLLGYNIPDIPLFKNKIPLPAWAVEGRLGGFFKPFDIGFKYGVMPKMNLVKSFDLNYKMVGADFRWALLDGKEKLLLPNVSIGLGFNYLSGGIGASVGMHTNFDIDGDTLTIVSPKINLLWDTKSLEAKLQISKQILIVSPYLGLGAGYSWSKAGYDLKTEAKFNGNPITNADSQKINNYLAAAGLEKMNFALDGISSMVDVRSWNFHAFGGVSVNIFIFKLDLTLMFNFLDKQYGASLGARLQL